MADPGTTEATAQGWVARFWKRLKALPYETLITNAAKLAAPAAVIVGTILAQNFESSQRATQLLAAREQADTQIRAEMFRAITERLLNNDDPRRGVIFTELLTLNFHEHFELKPLLVSVDVELEREAAKLEREAAGLVRRAAELDSEGKRGKEEQLARIRDKQAINNNRQAEITESRQELAFIARRVRDRQIRTLVRDDDSTAKEWKPWFIDKGTQASNFENGSITPISVHFNGPLPADDDKDAFSACDAHKDDIKEKGGKRGCAKEALRFNAPDGRGAIILTVMPTSDWKRDWERKKFTILVKPAKYQPARIQPAEYGKETLPKKATARTCDLKPSDKQAKQKPVASREGAVEFEATLFDLPLTDNTQLWSGSRYAVFIDRICPDPDSGEEGGSYVVKLSLMWFPKDYFPPRERPTNYRDLREKLNLPLTE